MWGVYACLGIKGMKRPFTSLKKSIQLRGEVFLSKTKSFYTEENFLFQALEYKFHDLKHKFQGLEYKFQALEQKIVLGEKTFSANSGIFLF